MKLQKIECPGCGSHLNAQEGVSRVECEFCGTSVIVEDSKLEGYNQELGKMEARANVSHNLADSITELINPLCDMNNRTNELNALTKQLDAFKRQNEMFKKGAKYYPYIIASVIAFLFLSILNSCKAPFILYLIFDVIAVLLYPIMGKLVYQYWDNISSSISDTEKAILQNKKTINDYNNIIASHPDIKIPPKYRNPKAMTFISKAVGSQGANTLEHAFSQYEELLMREKTIALQEEQIRLQKEQMAQIQNMQKNGGQVKVIRQRGHSIVFHVILCFFGIGFITIPYYTISKNHYWHL